MTKEELLKGEIYKYNNIHIVQYGTIGNLQIYGDVLSWDSKNDWLWNLEIQLATEEEKKCFLACQKANGNLSKKLVLGEPEKWEPKVGLWVKRISGGSNLGMKEGDVGIICASLKDMVLKERQKVVGYKILDIPDPVVLQPIPGGYLIVTAWGDEASDPIVVNHKNN